MKDILPILRSLGLLDSEIKTYMSGLEHGPGTVLDFAKHTRLSRQAIYVAIESLTTRGLMSSAIHGKKRFYASEHPEKLLSYAERRETEMKERIQDLKRALPEIELQMGGERPMVRVFEGREGIRAIINDIEKNRPKNTYEISDLDALRKVLPVEELIPMRNLFKQIGMEGIGLHGGEIITKSSTAHRYHLPKDEWGFHANLTVYGNHVALATFEGKMYSIIIESPAIAKTFMLLFKYAIIGAQTKNLDRV